MKEEGYVETFRLCLCFMNIYVLMFGVNLQCINIIIMIMIMFGEHLILDYNYVL